MSTESQNQANRRNAQKSTGPKTAEGKAVVAQNAVKPCPERSRGNGLFAHENVIKCEKQSDFERFRDELLGGLAPMGGVEAMLAERIVSLSWRLKRVERMNSEAIDVMMARIETNWLDREQREEAGLLDRESGRSELTLGWAMIKDFSISNVLEKLLMYEKRIESSLYKAMNELQKLQRLWKKEQEEIERPPIHRGRDAHETQGRDALATEDTTHRGRDAHETQGRDALATEGATHCGRDAHETQGRDALAMGTATGSEEKEAEFEKQSQIVKTGTEGQRYIGTE